MTISSTNTKNSYSGDGTTVAFSYTFKILDDDDIQVILRTDATGTETVQTKTTDYTVSGVGNAGGGTITFGSAPAATETVVLLRNVPLTQTTDYTPNDPFPAATHEDALDKLTLMAQDTQEEVDRSIKLSRTNTMTSTEFTVGATTRANKIFAFDSSGELAVTQEIGTFQGDWAASTAYAERDLVKDTSTNNIFIVNSAHTSSGSQPLTTNPNSSKYDLIVDAAAATTSATNAASSATAAAASATAAAASESAAATSETNAAASEAGVAADAAAAAASAASASTSATNASTSETNASNSASAAATSATNAATSATSASNSASAAGTSESNAATSATNASNSASAAATSASNAATSESNASTSETNAATSASSAASDASAAATSAAAAAASFDAFDDIYLGAKASAPTVDNDGDALTEGDQYFNTTNNTLFVWNGSAWQAASPDIVGDTTPQLGGNLGTNGNDINFGDNDKAVFGAGSDLQIYHDAGNSRIVDAGTGNLNLQADNNVNILNNAGTEFKAQFITDGAVNLFYDNSKKLATTSTGIDVTGTVTADGLTVDGANTIDLTSDSGTTLKLSRDGSAGQIASIVMQDGGDAQNRINSSGGALEFEYGSSNTNAMKIANNGDVSLYADDGTTQGFFWDANEVRLGLGTTSPARNLHLYAENSDASVRFQNTANSKVWEINPSIPGVANSGLSIYNVTDTTVAMHIDNSGNVGIGTSSPSFPLTIENSANHLYLKQSNQDNGWLINTADADGELHFSRRGEGASPSNNERLTISTAGNVGIGTSSPSTKLTVTESTVGDLITVTGANGTDLRIGNHASANGGIYINSQAASDDLRFRTQNSDRMTIDSSGNVGIGTTTMSGILNVSNSGSNSLVVVNNASGASGDTGTIVATNNVDSDLQIRISKTGASSKYAWIGPGTSTPIIFATAATERLRIDSSGNVGIGTTSPSYLTEISGSGGGDAVTLALTNAVSGPARLRLNSGHGNWSVGNSITVADALEFRDESASSTRMLIDSSGNVLVGTTTQIFGADFITNLVGTRPLAIKNTSTTAADNSEVVWHVGTTGDNRFIEFGTESSYTQRGSITYNRGAGLTAYNTTSDYRLKENIVALPNALATVSQLRPRQFDWKETGNTTTGFIAHELAEVLPHAVTGEQDAVDAEGKPVYQGIDTSFLVATLTKAIQEQQTIITALEARLAALEAN